MHLNHPYMHCFYLLNLNSKVKHDLKHKHYTSTLINIFVFTELMTLLNNFTVLL